VQRPGSTRAGSIQWWQQARFAINPDMSTETAPPETAAPQASQTPTATHTAKDGKGVLITEPAMRQLAALMQQQGVGKVLRVGVRSGGCSGMSYTMDFIENEGIQADDERYTYEPADAPSFEVVCDPKSLLYIYGMQLDFSSALIGGGFNFTNPNATQTCGCGSSFAV
jgi:iron-sulfur cluster assembly accessory protein